MLKTERIRQTTTLTWAASTAPAMDLDGVGLVTRYEMNVQLTPSATLVAANQPDGLFRPVQNLAIVAGGTQYVGLPSEAGGEGGVLLHILNVVDRLGRGHPGVGVTAPQLSYTPVRFVIHCGVRPQRKDNIDNPFDLSAFIPASQVAGLQLTWTTPGNAVMDDVVTLSSAILVVTANRVLGTEAEIMAEMAAQGIYDILPPGAKGMVPSWVGTLQSPTTTWAAYGLEVDAVLGGFLKRYTCVTQDATGTRPIRASDELTQLALKLNDEGYDLLRVDTENLSGALPAIEQQGADDAVPFGGAVAQGVYVVDLRPFGRNGSELAYGRDLRGKPVGSVKWAQTVGTNAAGDDYLSLSERYIPWNERLSNT